MEFVQEKERITMLNTHKFLKWYEKNKDKYVNIEMAGRIFGGSIDESPQKPREYFLTEDEFKLHFATTEVLTIINPSSFEIGSYQELIIPRADKVSFGWHYYGRSQTPENWCIETFELIEDMVQYTRSGPLNPMISSFTFQEGAFVRLF